MKKREILNKSHEEIYNAIGKASSISAKFDMFMDWFWKVTMNDIHGLKDDVENLKKTMWKLLGIFSAIIFILQTLVFPFVIKLIFSNLIK